jgi:UDP-N-acetyl-D-mannosaminuronic acid dehydrogenase
MLGPVLQDGALVIVESTIAPGTMTGLVIPELERTSGKRAGQGFYVGHCPERVTPGLLLHNLTHVNRTVGGQNMEIAQAMVAFYRHFVSADLDPTDLLTAEIVKTAENTYRDVQIAFANELALICEALGANVYTVRELVNKSPGRAMLFPGAGVGGHCIPKDSWLLIANVGEAYQAKLIPAARAVNTQMPYHMIELLEAALAKHGIPLQAGVRIAVLGYAFRENTDDDRDSPSKYLVEGLRARGVISVIHDPYVPGYETSLETALRGAHAAVIMVAHQWYHDLDLPQMRDWMAVPVLVDGRNVVDAAAARQSGFTYLGVGNRAN